MSLQLENLSTKELKEIINFASDKLIRQEKFNVNFQALTIAEYYHSDVFKRTLKLQKENKFKKTLSSLIYLLTLDGETKANDVIVFIDRLEQKLRLSKEHRLVDLLSVTFHELGHIHQHQKVTEYNIFDRFIIDTELFVKYLDPSHYNKFWGTYFSEASADLYGIIKTEEFLIDYPLFYQKNKSYIEKKKDLFNFTKNSYDFNFIFNKFHKLSASSEIRLSIHELIYYPNSNNFMDVNTISYNGENLKDEENRKFCFAIFSSDAFIEQLDFNSLSITEIEIMIDAVKYSLEQEIEKKNYLKDYLNNSKVNLQTIAILYDQRNILVTRNSRIALLESTLDKLNVLYSNYSLVNDIENNPNKAK